MATAGNGKKPGRGRAKLFDPDKVKWNPRGSNIQRHWDAPFEVASYASLTETFLKPFLGDRQGGLGPVVLRGDPLVDKWLGPGQVEEEVF